jgi:hypothetical protein
MNNQKWYDTGGAYDVGIVTSSLNDGIEITIHIGTDDNEAVLRIEDAIELYEMLPRVIEDAKNHNKIFGNRRRNDLQNRIVELQKELDSLEY